MSKRGLPKESRLPLLSIKALHLPLVELMASLRLLTYQTEAI